MKKGIVKGKASDERATYKEEQVAHDYALGHWRVGFFDIETTHLKGNFGHVLCACLKDAGGRIQTFRVDSYPGFRKDMRNDSALVKDISKALYAYDMVVTYNGYWFDFMFLDTRLTKHGLEMSPKVLHVDLLYHARKAFQLHSYRLVSLASFLKIPAKETPLDTETWGAAAYGDKKSMDYVVQHCKEDVATLEGCFNLMRGYISCIFRRR